MKNSIDKRVSLVLIAAVVAIVLAPLSTGAALAKPSDQPNTKVRAIQSGNSLDDTNQGQLGLPVDCVSGIQGPSGTADSVICYLLPDNIATPNYASTPIPPQTSTTETNCPANVGFDSSYKCFTTTYAASWFTPGHWRFVSVFYKSGQIVDIKGSNEWTNHSFFVLPESPVGVAGLMVASLGGFGAFMFLKRRKQASVIGQ